MSDKEFCWLTLPPTHHSCFEFFDLLLDIDGKMTNSNAYSVCQDTEV